MEHGFKAKTIKAILRRKINKWIDTLPESLQEQVKNDTIVTGGCIASMLLGEQVNDFDIYFRTKDTTRKIAGHYVTQFEAARDKRGGVAMPMRVEEMTDVRGEPRVRIVVKSAGVEGEEGDSDYQYFEGRPPEEAQDYISEVYDDPLEVADLQDEVKEAVAECDSGETPFRPVFLSSNAITLSDKIQIVIRFFGEPDEIHSNYDFIHCTNYWDSKSGELVLRPEALSALLSRTLVYRGSRYPLASIIRLRKFIKRGWRINAGQILKMALQVSKLDLENINVLEDQLTGVDVAYFAQVIRQAKSKDAEKIDSAYLVEIVDRMFGE